VIRTEGEDRVIDAAESLNPPVHSSLADLEHAGDAGFSTPFASTLPSSDLDRWAGPKAPVPQLRVIDPPVFVIDPSSFKYKVQVLLGKEGVSVVAGSDPTP
jgi:hypothetical protein